MADVSKLLWAPMSYTLFAVVYLYLELLEVFLLLSYMGIGDFYTLQDTLFIVYNSGP